MASFLVPADGDCKIFKQCVVCVQRLVIGFVEKIIAITMMHVLCVFWCTVL